MLFISLLTVVFSLWIIYDAFSQMAFFSFLPRFIPEPYASLLCLVAWGWLLLNAIVYGIKDGTLFKFRSILYIIVLLALGYVEYQSIQGDLANLIDAIKTAWPV